MTTTNQQVLTAAESMPKATRTVAAPHPTAKPMGVVGQPRRPPYGRLVSKSGSKRVALEWDSIRERVPGWTTKRILTAPDYKRDWWRTLLDTDVIKMWTRSLNSEVMRPSLFGSFSSILFYEDAEFVMVSDIWEDRDYPGWKFRLRTSGSDYPQRAKIFNNPMGDYSQLEFSSDEGKSWAPSVDMKVIARRLLNLDGTIRRQEESRKAINESTDTTFGSIVIRTYSGLE